MRRLGLTAKGKRRLDKALPHWREAQRRMVEELGAERWVRLLDDLAASVEAAQRQ